MTFSAKTYSYLTVIYVVVALPFISNGQIVKVAKEYYRVNPFEGKFSAFTNALTADPELKDKAIMLATDTSGFFLKGSYEVFNPFSFDAKRVDVVFVQEEQKIENKSIQGSYPYYTYQITAYFDDNVGNRSLVLKDFNLLKKKIGRETGLGKEMIDLKGIQNIEAGEILNYYFDQSLVYPVTLSWQTLSSSKRLALTLLIRIAVVNNYAYPSGGNLITRSQPANRYLPSTGNFFEDW